MNMTKFTREKIEGVIKLSRELVEANRKGVGLSGTNL